MPDFFLGSVCLLFLLTPLKKSEVVCVYVCVYTKIHKVPKINMGDFLGGTP